MLDFILIIICSIVLFLFLVKFVRWGINNFSNEEIMDTFRLRDVFFPFLFLFWLVLITTGIYNLIFYRDKIFTQEMLSAFSEIHINMDALIKNSPILIIMLLVVIFILLIIPIICLIYYHKHKKFLKLENIKDYKKIARTHFFMGLTSPLFFALFLGPKFIIDMLPTGNSSKKFSTYYTKITDSKGNTTYVDTIIDNENGLGTTKVEDSKGNKSYHTTYKD